MTSRTPPLLEPYLSLPPETSFILLTNVLGASTNWLVLRYLHGFLAPLAKNPEDEYGNGEGTSVVLVSFLRDWAFWREGARKLVGFSL
jgi:elongator complex protein 6